MTPDADVIVLGAGVAGLSAARNITAAGHSVLVLDARSRTGGRVHYGAFEAAAHAVEYGGAWVSSRFHPHVMAEVRRYGLKLIVEPDFSWLWALDESMYAPGFPLTGNELYDLERGFADIIFAARRIDRAVRRDQQADLADLDVPFESWIKMLGLSPRVEKFLFMAASIGTGAREAEFSALSVLSLVAGMDCSALGYISACSERFVDGTASLIDALASTPGIEVRLDQVVHHVVQDDDKVEVHTRDCALTARQVVVTLPVNCWSDVTFDPPLNEAKQKLARRRHPNQMLKLYLLADKDPGDIFTLGRETDLLCVATQYRTERGVVLVAFASPPSTFQPHSREDVERAFAQVLPHARLLDYAWHDWNADPFSRGAWMVYPPGHLAQEATAIAAHEGRLSFAGSDIATTWIGWMEGALETAERAAEEVLRRLDSPTRLRD